MAFAAAIVALVLPAACQINGEAQPARLSSFDAQAREQVVTVLSKAVGRAQIALGPEDLSEVTSISVLPPTPGPHEGNSPALPLVFDLRLQDGACYLVCRDSGEAYLLEGLSCEALASDP